MVALKDDETGRTGTYRGRSKYDPALAEHYLKRSELRRGPENDVLLRILGRHGLGRTLLDAPCGVGRVGVLLRPGELRYVGADLSPEMLARAAPRLAAQGIDHQLLRCDLEHPPFASRAFDTTLCLRFLHHLPEGTRGAVLRELARLTDRLLVVTYFHPLALHYLARRARSLLSRLRGRPGSDRYSNTESWLARQVEPEGFRLVGGYGTGFLRETRYAVFERT